MVSYEVLGHLVEEELARPDIVLLAGSQGWDHEAIADVDVALVARRVRASSPLCSTRRNAFGQIIETGTTSYRLARLA